MHVIIDSPSVQPPKKNNKSYIVIAVIAIIGGLLGFLFMNSNGSKDSIGKEVACKADEEYDETLKKCVKKEEDPKTVCEAAEKYWDDDSSTCLTKEEKEEKEKQEEKTACEAKSDYSWDDSKESCEYDAKKACNAAGDVWDGGSCYTAQEWDLIQQQTACTAAGNVWETSTNSCFQNAKYPAGNYYLTSIDMNVRTGPSTNYPVIRMINIADHVTVPITKVTTEYVGSGTVKYWGLTTDGWICIEINGYNYLAQ